MLFSNLKAVIDSHWNSSNWSNCKQTPITFIQYQLLKKWLWNKFCKFLWKLCLAKLCWIFQVKLEAKRTKYWQKLCLRPSIMAASVKCHLSFPHTALIIKDMNIRGHSFLQFFANLSQCFSIKIALLSFLLKNKSTQNMLQLLTKTVTQTPFPQFQCWLFKF